MKELSDFEVEWDLSPKKETSYQWLINASMLFSVLFLFAFCNKEDVNVCEYPPIDYVKPNTVYDDYQIAAWYLKSKESLRLESYPDGLLPNKETRYSIGWGTKSFKGEKITLKEADRRFKFEFEKRYRYITSKYPRKNKWQRLILSCIRYNVGGFYRHGKALHNSILKDDSDAFKKALRRYVTNSKGEVLDGLKKRREEDIKMIFMPESERDIMGVELKRNVFNKIQKYR